MLDRLINCKKCGALIDFVKTRNDSYMPVNPQLIKLINFHGDIVEGYLPHWATCPAANEFRKRGGKNGD